MGWNHQPVLEYFWTEVMYLWSILVYLVILVPEKITSQNKSWANSIFVGLETIWLLYLEIGKVNKFLNGSNWKCWKHVFNCRFGIISIETIISEACYFQIPGKSHNNFYPICCLEEFHSFSPQNGVRFFLEKNQISRCVDPKEHSLLKKFKQQHGLLEVVVFSRFFFLPPKMVVWTVVIKLPIFGGETILSAWSLGW